MGITSSQEHLNRVLETHKPGTSLQWSKDDIDVVVLMNHKATISRLLKDTSYLDMVLRAAIKYWREPLMQRCFDVASREQLGTDWVKKNTLLAAVEVSGTANDGFDPVTILVEHNVDVLQHNECALNTARTSRYRNVELTLLRAKYPKITQALRDGDKDAFRLRMNKVGRKKYKDKEDRGRFRLHHADLLNRRSMNPPHTPVRSAPHSGIPSDLLVLLRHIRGDSVVGNKKEQVSMGGRVRTVDVPVLYPGADIVDSYLYELGYT